MLQTRKDAAADKTLRWLSGLCAIEQYKHPIWESAMMHDVPSNTQLAFLYPNDSSNLSIWKDGDGQAQGAWVLQGAAPDMKTLMTLLGVVFKHALFADGWTALSGNKLLQKNVVLPGRDPWVERLRVQLAPRGSFVDLDAVVLAKVAASHDWLLWDGSLAHVEGDYTDELRAFSMASAARADAEIERRDKKVIYENAREKLLEKTGMAKLNAEVPKNAKGKRRQSSGVADADALENSTNKRLRRDTAFVLPSQPLLPHDPLNSVRLSSSNVHPQAAVPIAALRDPIPHAMEATSGLQLHFALQHNHSERLSLANSPVKLSIDTAQEADLPTNVARSRTEPIPRNVYITAWMLKKFGFTENCEGCNHKKVAKRKRVICPSHKAHNAECRSRIEEMLSKDRRGKKLLQAATARLQSSAKAEKTQIEEDDLKAEHVLTMEMRVSKKTQETIKRKREVEARNYM